MFQVALDTDVSRQLLRPIFNGQEFLEEYFLHFLTLEMGPINCPENSVSTILHCVTPQIVLGTGYLKWDQLFVSKRR